MTRQGEMRLEALSESGKTRLLAFLEAAVPQMEHALAENEQSATFDDDVVAAAALEDDTARAPECVHALDPRPSPRRVPTRVAAARRATSVSGATSCPRA